MPCAAHKWLYLCDLVYGLIFCNWPHLWMTPCMPHLCAAHAVFVCVPWGIYMSDTTHSSDMSVSHILVTHINEVIYMRHMSYLYVRYEALICVTQRIRAPEHTCLRVHIHVYINMRHVASNVACLVYMRHRFVTQRIRVTYMCRTYMCGTYLYVPHIHEAYHIWRIMSNISASCRIRMSRVCWGAWVRHVAWVTYEWVIRISEWLIISRLSHDVSTSCDKRERIIAFSHPSFPQIISCFLCEYITRINVACYTYGSGMRWLRLVGSLTTQVSFAKEPNKRDYILHKKPVF